MLLVKDFFKTFTDKAIVDSSKSTEALLCLSCESRAEVDAVVEKAVTTHRAIEAVWRIESAKVIAHVARPTRASSSHCA